MGTQHPLSRRRVLLEACLAWYATRPDAAKQVERVLNRLSGQQQQQQQQCHPISLRVIEFFLNTQLRGQDHALYWAYQRHLRIYGKASFDVFCREPKQAYKLCEGVEEVQSTPAQLEFMRWFIESKAMALLEKELEEVLSAKQRHQGEAKRRQRQKQQLLKRKSSSPPADPSTTQAPKKPRAAAQQGASEAADSEKGL